MKKRRIFLSYQRSSSKIYARYIVDKLEDWGMDVFLDVEDITQGRFDEIIGREIADREYFIVILTPKTLQSEWVVREIETALRHRKHIISILMDEFDFNIPLPPSIIQLKYYHGLPYIHEYADSFFDKLKQALRRDLTLPTAKQPTVASYMTRMQQRQSRQFWIAIFGIAVFIFTALLALAAYALSGDNGRGDANTATAIATDASTQAVQSDETPAEESSYTLRLVYTDNYAFLLNIGTRNIDIGHLSFVQGLREFEAEDWRTDYYAVGSRGSIDALPPNGCYQVFRVGADEPAMPEGCPRRFGWVSRFNGTFWLPADDSVTQFQVYQYDSPIATCDIAAGVCEFSIP